MLRTSLSVSISVLTSVLILTALIYTFDLLVLQAHPNSPTNTPILSVDPNQKPLPVRLILLPSMIGYIEPCGCTIDLKLGG